MRSIRLAHHAATALLGAVLLASCSSAVDQGPGDAAKITSTTNAQLAGVVGTTIGPFVFVVTDADGNLVPNVTVNFTITGPGTLNTTTATTDNGGSVVTTASFGHTVGTITVTATAAGVTTSANATAQATADVPAKLVKTSGDGSAPVGSPIVENLSVRVTDQYDNPISGILINWTATFGGSVGAASTHTDNLGNSGIGFTPTRVGASTVTAATTFGSAQFTVIGT